MKTIKKIGLGVRVATGSMSLLASCIAPPIQYVENGNGYKFTASTVFGSSGVTFDDAHSRFMSDNVGWTASNIVQIDDNVEAQNVWSYVIGHDTNNINERLVTAQGWGVRHVVIGWVPGNDPATWNADITPY